MNPEAARPGDALDVLEILHELDLRDVVFVGHSVSAMIGVLASIAEPDRFGSLVLVSPSGTMAPVIMGNPDRPELGDDLRDSFCRVDPVIARLFARVTFLADNRHDLERVTVPTLILQSAVDAIAPPTVGTYVQQHIPGSELVVLDVSGHCPHLSAPVPTTEAIREFVDRVHALP